MYPAIISKITAPWAQETVDKLNAMQRDERQHPYTCPGDRPFCKLHRNLIATPDGWVCRCGHYAQDWAIFHTPL